jgi:hypothetical protein
MILKTVEFDSATDMVAFAKALEGARDMSRSMWVYTKDDAGLRNVLHLDPAEKPQEHEVTLHAVRFKTDRNGEIVGIWFPTLESMTYGPWELDHPDIRKYISRFELDMFAMEAKDAAADG